MSNYIIINGSEHVHLLDVKRIREITDQERQSLAGLGAHVEADRFNTRIDHANNAKSYAPETIDEIAAQGVRLVQVEADSFVPRDNINKTRNLTALDRKEFEEKTGRPLRDDFKSQIDMRAGRILSTADSREIMRRMSQPYQPSSKDASAPTNEKTNALKADRASAKNLENTRDAVMNKVSKTHEKTKPGNDPSRTPPHQPSQ